MNIGFDLDDTIIDQTENKIRLAAKFGYQLNEYEVQGNVFDDHVPQPDHLKQIKKELYGSHTLIAKPMPESVSVLTELSRQSHELYIISRRDENSQDNARRWIKENIPIFKNENIIFIKEDFVKRKIIQDKNISLYVDDKYKIIRELRDITNPVLFVSPHIADWNNEDVGITFIRNWLELIDIVKAFSE